MIDINDIKNGMTVIVEGNLYQIVDFLHVKPGKGAAFMKTKLKNLRTGGTIEKTFNTNIKIEKANISKKTMQYLYNTSDMYYFMDMNTYEQVELSEKQIENEKKYLKENLEVELVYFESELIGLNLPEKVEYKVTYTTDAVKGNTSTNALKDATLENGLEVKVPLFICEGDVVVISTKDGKYVSRK
ncbi:MAG: elongation factor P [Bacilli bacterium]|jgi:elongation factor P|nr:elongation factor P [Bacilli bacterium]HCJ32274.1 elongation factor P [Bacillota bacterium]